MVERKYQKYVFDVIYSKLAGPEGDTLGDLFDIRDEGVWPKQSDDDVLGWTPVQECYEPGRASPIASPSLPFPFTARQLAAFMLDGIGYFVRERVGPWDDGPDASLFRDREVEALEVLQAAYVAYAEAESDVGKRSVSLDLAANGLRKKHQRAFKTASRRRKLDEVDRYSVEWDKRRARAAASVSKIEAQADLAEVVAANARARWRKAMAIHLLYQHGDTLPSIAVKAKTRAQAHREAILDALKLLGYDPLSLPRRPSGKAWVVKQKVKAQLRHTCSDAVINKAWRELRAAGYLVEDGRP